MVNKKTCAVNVAARQADELSKTIKLIERRASVVQKEKTLEEKREEYLSELMRMVLRASLMKAEIRAHLRHARELGLTKSELRGVLRRRSRSL